MPFLIGFLLLLSVSLKVMSFDETLAQQSAIGVSLPLQIVAVQVELLVGFLLLSGRWPRLSWLASVVLFVVFAAFAVTRIIGGGESCGCFGPLKVSPRWTFVLDLVVITLLVIRRQEFESRHEAHVRKSRVMAGTIGYAVLSGLSLFLMARSAPTSLSDISSGNDDGAIIVLTPSDWIDQKFPLADMMSPRFELVDGEWIVLLYHHDCSKCQDALPRYERLADGDGEHNGATQVLLVEVPPYGGIKNYSGQAKQARLSADWDWFVQTPVEIQLSDGKVRRASLDLPSLAQLPNVTGMTHGD